jgi:hypothetical protein
VFGPHDREDAQLDEVGLAAQRAEHARIFFFRQAVGGDDFSGDLDMESALGACARLR